MDELQDPDMDQHMIRLREKIRNRREKAASSVSSTDGIVKDLATLDSSSDAFTVRFTSHRKILMPFAMLSKRLLRRLLTPILRQQGVYNLANARVGKHLLARLESMNQEQSETCQVMVGKLQEMHDAQERLRDEFVSLQAQTGQSMQTLALQTQASQSMREQFEAQLQSLGQTLALHAQTGLAMREQFDVQVRSQEELKQNLLALLAKFQDLEQQAGKLSVAEEQWGNDLRAAQALIQQAAETQGRALSEQQSLRERISRTERKLRRLLYAPGDPGASPVSRDSILVPPAISAASGFEFDYFGFEERFRGSDENIKQRQSPYVQHFERSENVLDLGCGRGEFLELLRDAGIKAHGLDRDLDMVLCCKDKGLDVIQGDLEHVEKLPDESLGGIFCAQVIEHLSVEQMIRLIHLAHRKLRPGGRIVVETLNPESLFVHYRWFWMDLTHTRLVHPETLKFLFESTGFRDVSCLFLPSQAEPSTHPPIELHGSKELTTRFNQATDYLNKLLYGSSDYAVIARR